MKRIVVIDVSPPGPGGTELRQVPVQIGVIDSALAEVRGEGRREGAGAELGCAATT